MKQISRVNLNKFFRALIMALVLLVPAFLLMGCDETASYTIEVKSSWAVNGTTLGGGTYTEGSTVTLTANGNNGNRVIAWVYQNKTILESDNTYTITTSSDGLTSTLTFTASASTADKYTAVFEDTSQTYYTLSSFKITSNLNATEPAEDALFTGVLNVYFGENVNSFRSAYTYDGTFTDNNEVETSDVNQVVYFSSSSTDANDNKIYYIKFSLSGDSKTLISSTNTILTYMQGDEDIAYDHTSTIIVYNTDKSYTIYSPFSYTANEVETSYYLVLNISPLTYQG